MAKIQIGNNTKVISNNLFVSSNTRTIDPCYWYMELFDTMPVNIFLMDINRIDEDEEFDVHNLIYNDLINSGDFTPIMYEYNKEKKKTVGNIPKLLGGNNGKTEEVYTSRFYVVSKYEPLIIFYDYDEMGIMTHLGVDKIEEVAEKYLNKYNQDDDKIKCHVIVKDPDLYLEDFDIDLKGDLDFDMYNDGFEDIHNTIVNSIVNDRNGLYLLYGKPGTGKSTYIRHLIKLCGTDKRQFVYVPSKLFEDFTDPGLLPFLMRHKGCVFIIEDCENLVTVDDGIRSDSITDLLNMTDGLLADALNIKIICTFNTDYTKIDDALLRPGRCRCKYEFELLDRKKANKVAAKYNLKDVNKDVSLAELFNPEIGFTDERKKKIGFN